MQVAAAAIIATISIIQRGLISPLNATNKFTNLTSTSTRAPQAFAPGFRNDTSNSTTTTTTTTTSEADSEKEKERERDRERELEREREREAERGRRARELEEQERQRDEVQKERNKQLVKVKSFLTCHQ